MIYQEQLFTKEECEKIISYSTLDNTEPLFDFSNMKHGTYSKNRIMFPKQASYNVYLISNNSETEWMFNKLLTWFSKVNNVKLNSNVVHPVCTLHNYIVGDKFAKHIDLSKGFEDRRYNAGIQLNNDYIGGEYVCWDSNNNEIVFSKEVGTAISYHASVPHEIKEIKEGNRWSIVMPIYEWEIVEKKSLL